LTLQPAPEKIFRLPRSYRLLMSFLMSLACFFPSAVLLHLLIIDVSLWLAAELAAHSLLFFLFFRYWSLYSLAVSPSRIEYRAPVYRIRTTWDNVEAIAPVGGWSRPVQGFLLRRAVGRYPLLAVLIALPRRDLARSIPLEIFAVRRWENSALGQEIRRLAPHLLGLTPP
jgi:hypothetical protein